jgi:hypothetical protein
MLVCLLLTGTAAAQFFVTDGRVTETLAHGEVHWTDSAVLSRGSATGATRRGAGAATSQAAIQAARQHLRTALEQVRLDATQMLGPVLYPTAAQRHEVEALLAQAAAVETRYLPGGVVETTVHMSFAGRLTALLLPPSTASQPESEAKTAAVHTGVVIDARGLAIQPALFPRLVDDRSQALYAPDLVEVEAAVQQGYIAYAKTFDHASIQARIGANPLVVRALRVAGASRVDLVLSQAEATRLRDYAATRRLLRQCRVVIVI